MFKKAILTLAFVAVSATAALACQYNKSVQSPVPPVASAPEATPVPAEPKEKDVADADTKKDEKTN